MQNRKNIIYIFSVMILVLFTVSGCQQKKINWKETYDADQTIPYGTYITYNLLKDVFPNSKIKKSRLGISLIAEKQVEHFVGIKFNTETGEYEREILIQELNARDLNEYYEKTDIEKPKMSLLFISSLFSPSSSSLKSLYHLVGSGNDVFISANSFDDDLLKYLQISHLSDVNDGSNQVLTDYPGVTYEMLSSNRSYWKFKANYPLTIDVLARCEDSGKPSFIRIKYGKGYFYLHTNPAAFTNLHMLDLNRYEYGFRCLSYLQDGSNVIWDESLTKGPLGSRGDGGNTSTMFRAIYASPALTWALHIILIGLLLFMIFRSKRTQRIIPDIVRPKNTTIEFLDTISNMYYKRRDYISYIEKRHMFFLDFVRRNYYMSTEQIDSEFYKDLTSKSGVSPSVIKAIFSAYNTIINGGSASEDIFMEYNIQLERFYTKIKNKQTK